MKRILRYFNFPVFIAESFGLLLLLTGAYSLFLIENSENLALLFGPDDISDALEAMDMSWGDLNSSTYAWLAKARITAFFLTLIIVIIKKDNGRTLYLNALLLILPGVLLLTNQVEQSLYTMSYDTLSLFSGGTDNFKHGILCALFISFGFFFLLINISPLQKVFSKVFKKPHFNPL